MINVNEPSGKLVSKTTAVFSQNWYAMCMKRLFLFPIQMENDTSNLDFGTHLGCFDAALKNFNPNSPELDNKHHLTGPLLCHHTRNCPSWCTPKLNLHLYFSTTAGLKNILETAAIRSTCLIFCTEHITGYRNKEMKTLHSYKVLKIILFKSG